MRVFHITHTDLDGAGCAVIAHIAYQPNVNAPDTVYVNYDRIDDAIRTTLADIDDSLKSSKYASIKHVLLITDISPQGSDLYEHLDYIHGQGNVEVLCVDHHKTSADQLRSRPWAKHELGISATRLLYEYRYGIPERLPSTASTPLANFVMAVDAYDMWRTGSEFRARAEDLNRLFHFLSSEEFVRRFSVDLESDCSGDQSMMSLLKQRLRIAEDTYVGKAASSAVIRWDAKSRTYAIVFAEQYPSAIGHRILANNSRVDYVVIANAHHGFVGLRSRESGVDVAEIAKANGGGGHAVSAGFQIATPRIGRDIERYIFDLVSEER